MQLLQIGCKSSISEEKAGKVLSRGETHTGVRYAYFTEDQFSYLNIPILGYSHVDRTPQCSLACLETPTCFSYNLAAKPDINGKLLCELLPSDKYNNSDKFLSNKFFHHFSIASPCSGWPCKNDGTCLALYEENSYKCICNAGFTGRDCKNDIGECSSENECHVNATCMNTMGSYTCTCNSGYQGDGRNCADIDECSSENECHVNATCTNTIGSHNCTCKKGYGGDGRNCSDIDECSSENECHVNATCTNTRGSDICTCKKGYVGDGRNCSDIDEFSSENECHVNSTCTNTIGSYNCTCKKGYGGDGRNCSDYIAKGLGKSVIIGSNATYLVHLSEWLRPVSQSNSSWKLCWRVSKHGWASSKLHPLCDAKGLTVTIIKVNQYIFGGYVSVSWGK
ncbi:epidermal growth factor-like protein 6 isoform X6 [Montipora foliosa]|uniref:epidermal growth factor-like protein 6 isoform X6 n=1 Tax=Montipora foliosa TaxID=591990 RepID=UPI0035F20E45